jgi:hypothetical protein
MLDLDRAAMTDGPVGRVLLALAAPLVAQNVVYVANALVDTFWLGRVGEDAVAAVGLSLPVQSLLGATVVIGAVGTQILVSQRAGDGDATGARRVAVNGALVAFAVTAAVAVPVVVYAEEAVALLGADPALAGTTATYLAIVIAVLPVGAVGDTVENCFTAYGDTRAVFHVSLVSVLVNLVAAPVLVDCRRVERNQRRAEDRRRAERRARDQDLAAEARDGPRPGPQCQTLRVGLRRVAARFCLVRHHRTSASSGADTDPAFAWRTSVRLMRTTCWGSSPRRSSAAANRRSTM